MYAARGTIGLLLCRLLRFGHRPKMAASLLGTGIVYTGLVFPASYTVIHLIGSICVGYEDVTILNTNKLHTVMVSSIPVYV